MTREEARKAAEVMMAYADGKEVEFYEYDTDNKWNVDHSPVFDWSNLEYRIKKEPTYRPFKNKEECLNEMQKHQPSGWVRSNDGICNILYIGNVGINYLYNGDVDTLVYTDALARLVFADGTPFGIKVKE